MAIIIEEYSMPAEGADSVIAAATWASSHEWIAAPWPRYFTRHQPITAFTLAARLAAGHRDSSPFTAACGVLR